MTSCFSEKWPLVLFWQCGKFGALARFRNGLICKGAKKGSFTWKKWCCIFFAIQSAKLLVIKNENLRQLQFYFPVWAKNSWKGKYLNSRLTFCFILESHGLVSNFSFFESANTMFALFYTPAIYCNVGEYFASYRIMCRVVFHSQSPWRGLLQRDKTRLERWYLHQRKVQWKL